METNDVIEFRDLSRLVKVLKVSLGAFILIGLISAWSGWQELELLERVASGEWVSEEEANANDYRQWVLSVVSLLVFLLTAILICRWTYLSNKNARALGAEPMEHSPGWSAGWYFIPIACWWKPYQALREIFMASHPGHDADWKQAPSPDLMPLWWALWILSSVMGTIIGVAARNLETIEDYLRLSNLNFYSILLDVVTAAFLMILVSTLYTWQCQKANNLNPQVLGTTEAVSNHP